MFPRLKQSVQRDFCAMKLFLAFILLNLLTSTCGVLKTRFKSVKCTVLNNTVMKNNYCYLKAYSRTYVTINWAETRFLPIGKPLNVIKFVKKFCFDIVQFYR